MIKQTEVVRAEVDQQTVGSSSRLGDPNETRRRLIKGGLSAGPVILTLASRPSYAWHCRSPSGFVSGNGSTGHEALAYGSSARTPAQWLADAVWCNDTSALGGKHLFHPTFPTSPINFGAAATFKSVIQKWSTGTANEQFGAFILAAYINIQKGWVPGQCLTAAEVLKMWADGPLGSYQPSVGAVPWNKDDIIAYLKETWIVGAWGTSNSDPKL